MAWVETIKLKSGEKRFRVAERADDGRIGSCLRPTG
jgi:hypothetical protein